MGPQRPLPPPIDTAGHQLSIITPAQQEKAIRGSGGGATTESRNPDFPSDSKVLLTALHCRSSTHSRAEDSRTQSSERGKRTEETD
ncbi:hypothetical protein SRHO_G00243500 [Serrasalmus rhombeus]